MDDENVLKLLLSGESEQVERKEQLRNKKPEVCQAICASGVLQRADSYARLALICPRDNSSHVSSTPDSP